MVEVLEKEEGCLNTLLFSTFLRRTPRPVIVTMRDNKDCIRALLYSFYTTITRGWNPPKTFHLGREFILASPRNSRFPIRKMLLGYLLESETQS